MSNTTNFAEQEIIAGKLAAKRLRVALRSAINVETVKNTGALMRTTVTAKKDRRTSQLDRLTISSPHYGFKLNYGFEGIKSNGQAMRLPATNHLHSAIERTSILNELADTIGNLRADEVTAAIKF